MKGSGSYEDMLYMPHHRSKKHPHMSMADRAAQFAPFAALTGHGDAIRETERLTQRWIDLDEGIRNELDRKLQALRAWMAQPPELRPQVAVTYFKPDERKEGGEYLTAVGRIRKIDEAERCLIMSGGERIAVGEIVGLEEKEC